jgi:hypothetical protein
MGREYRKHGGGYKLVVQISVGGRAVVCVNSNIKIKKSNYVPVYAMKAYRGVEVQIHSFLVLALDGDERTTALPRDRTPLPITQEDRWAPTAGPTVFEEKNISCLYWDSKSGRSSL